MAQRPLQAWSVRARSAWAAALKAGLGLAWTLMLAACSSGPPIGGLPVVAEAPEQKPEPQSVALLLPLSAKGHAGIIGKSLKQAAELALFDRDNPNVQLMVKDDRGTPEGARAAAEQAITGGAKLILGPLFAKSVAAAAPVARQANVPVIAFSNDRHVAGNGVYLLGFQVEREVARIVAYAAQHGKRRFAALVAEDALGTLAAQSFKDEVSRAGGSIIALERYPASANGVLEPMRSISTVLRAAEEGGAAVDALFLPGGQENLETIARLIPQAEIKTDKVKMIGTGGMDYPNAGRDAALVGAWYPGPDPRGWSDFAQRYAKSYGQAPPRIASLAFDAVMLAVAVAADGRFSAAELTGRSFSGVDGTFHLLADGTAERALAILEVQQFGAAIIDAPQKVGDLRPSTASTLSHIVNFN
jgi:ABC-type branched-subunit amino acid transport system substrate-binding protein